MNAEPILAKIAKTFQDFRLEVILVGNAAAALHGAPVTTLDFDFMFRKTAPNLEKVKKVAEALGMSFSQPYYPASDLYRLVDKKTALQMKFMCWMQGVKSYESLRSRAAEMKFGTTVIWVADLKDIIRSKRALGVPKASLEALRKESDRAEREQIRLLLSLPMNKRTHFLRVRLPNGAFSALIVTSWLAGRPER